MRNISREEIKEKMDRDEEFVLLDVLEEPYYRHSHLPGAINIPVEEIGRVPEEIPDKDAEIIVYCMDPPCRKSGKAARELAAMGYEDVRDYAGGKKDWMEAGLPAEGSRSEREGSG